MAALLVVATATSCGTVRYYSQAIGGGAKILVARQPIAELLAEGGLDPEVEKVLEQVLTMRTFASQRLALPDNKSYRAYVDLDRPYATWTVTAAPRLSIEPRQWCYPIVGCLTYRGYFDQERAERYAARLEQEEEVDVAVGGVLAYSTLGWFADPVLSTFLGLPEPQLAGLLFHELAHQRVFVKGDTAFNESFATAVELVGVARWLEESGRAEEIADYRRTHELELEFVDLVLETRERLEGVYAEERADSWKLERKSELLEEMRRSWLAEVGEDGPYSAWMAQPLNNARLAAVGSYYEHLAAFEALLDEVNGELEAFYSRVEEIAELDSGERAAALAALTE